ncbi:hypothetical protein JCM8547_004870 [Rhodosporidiobolus lusitaniae]
MAAARTLSVRETLRLVRDFLEVALHSLLYIRQVYPPQLFSKAQKYNIEVWHSRHPALTEYIGRIVQCIDEEMQKGTIKRVILVITDNTLEENPLERFVFDIEWLIPDSKIPKGGEDWVPAEHGLAQGDVEDLLRACFLKMNFAQSRLKRLPAETSFKVLLEMKDDAPPPESKAAQQGHVPAEWIPAEQRHGVEEDDTNGPGVGRGRGSDGMSTISPLERVRLGVLSLDMRVEETAAKFEDDDDLMSSGEVGGGGEIHKMPDRKGKGRA